MCCVLQCIISTADGYISTECLSIYLSMCLSVNEVGVCLFVCLSVHSISQMLLTGLKLKKIVWNGKPWTKEEVIKF